MRSVRICADESCRSRRELRFGSSVAETGRCAHWRPRLSARPLRVVALALAASIALSACGGAKAAEDRPIQQLPGNILPPEMNGLEVRQEEITSTIKEQERSYVDAVGLYSFRKNDLLQATLQVSKFSKDAKYTTRKFRQAVILQIGTTVPKEARMAGKTVHVTTGKKQSVVIWFEGPYVLVLSSREDFTGARNLLRTLLEVKL